MLQTTRTNLMKKLFVLLIALFVLNSLEGYGQEERNNWRTNSENSIINGITK